MRYGMTLLCCAAVVVGCGSSSDKETFHANMTSAQEIPAPSVNTPTPVGTAQFTNNGNGTVSYTVTGSNMTVSTGTPAVTFTGMHIHLAPAGQTAVVTVPFTTPANGATSFTQTGTFTSTTCGGATTTNCINSPATFDSVLTAMRNGGAYLNVHTSRNTGGELRGQIQTGGL